MHRCYSFRSLRAGGGAGAALSSNREIDRLGSNDATGCRHRLGRGCIPRWLITNLHVVGDQDRVEAFFPVEQKGKNTPFLTQRLYYLENQKRLHEEGRAVRGKVILRREKSDLALVELAKIPDGIQSLPLAREVPAPGDTVLSVGHRRDSEALWVLTVGEVRQKGHLTDGYFWRSKRLAENAPCWIVQSPINSGDSGTPW